MYVIDITRDDDFTTNDMLVGKDSIDAKSKTMNYIMDYALANCNLYIGRDLLDQNLDMNSFSLKEFIKSNYLQDIEKDLLIQNIITDKEHCLFVKHFDSNIDIMPNVYIFDKGQEKLAKSTLAYLVNESLLNKYEDNLELYEEQKYDIKNPRLLNYNSKDINSEVISLYKGGLFLEELLNNSFSLNQMNKNYNLKI